jgi:3-oxoacid CoA-transferase subunit B
MPWTREQMAARAARELKDGDYVNLGIGIPTLVANFIPKDIDVALQSENGMFGMGRFPTSVRSTLTSLTPAGRRSRRCQPRASSRQPKASR